MPGRLADLAQQRARLEAKAADLRAREKALARQSDSRRKIVVGAIILKAAETDGRAREWLVAQLRKAVAARDRHLFAELLTDRNERDRPLSEVAGTDGPRKRVARPSDSCAEP